MVIECGHHVARQYRFRLTVFGNARTDQLLNFLHHHRHGTVMRLNKAPVFPDQRHDGDTFGSRKRQVIAAAVLIHPINHTGEVRTVRKFTLTHRIHIGTGNFALQAQLLRALAHPAGLQ
ncbi:Uncharacterised protein [Escherichia coli]|nr:Uncharacterised protein [Escherichia coli]